VECVTHITEIKNSIRSLVGKPQLKRYLEKSRRRWKDNIKTQQNVEEYHRMSSDAGQRAVTDLSKHSAEIETTNS
jgi:hypothetical protein